MLFSIAEIPTPQEQLKFLKHIQQILQSGTLLCQRHSKIDPFYLTNGKVKLTPLISY